VRRQPEASASARKHVSRYRWTHSPCANGVRVYDLSLGVLQQQAEAAMQDAWRALGDGGSVLVCVHTHTCCLNT